MKPNEESVSDSRISDHLNTYFTLLRKNVGRCSVPSKIEDEILYILRFSLRSSNPVLFLRNNGIILFDKCSAFNISLFSKLVHSCKSRLSACFQREGWSNNMKDDQMYKRYLDRILSPNQSRLWSFREYPSSSQIVTFIKSTPQLVQTLPNDPPPEKKIEESPLELTLQTNIFSWTLFDDI